MSLNPQVFSRMHRLMFLKFGFKSHVHLFQGLEYLPNELRLLHWNHYPLNHLPSNFFAKNLVELVMWASKLQKLWDGVVPLVNLKRLNLNGSKYLVELPNFSMAENLVYLSLKYCERLLSAHPSLLSLPKLEELELAYCRNLTCLKSDVHLKSLQRVIMRCCTRLKEFSVISENMETLDLSRSAIDELPSSMGRNRKLEELNLYDCVSLRHLPINLMDMTSLWKLNVGNCVKLRSIPRLPPSIGMVGASNCRSLETLCPINSPVCYLQLENCMKLDQHLLSLIGFKSYLRLTNHGLKAVNHYLAFPSVGKRVIYPGNKVPEWFKYRTSHGSIIIAPQSQPEAVIFCVIVSPSLPRPSYLSVRCSFSDGTSLYEDFYSLGTVHFHHDSDHVYLYGCPASDTYGSSIRGFDVSAHNRKFSFKFYARDSKGRTHMVLKEFGVYLIYESDSERCNLMKEMELELELMGNNRTKRRDSEELQPLPPTKRLKQFDDSTNIQPL